VSRVIDPDRSGLFYWARKTNIEAHARGEKAPFCEICAAVRTAVEAPYEFTVADFSVPVPADREAQVREVASTLESIRLKWAGALAHVLTEAQLSFLRGRQEQWLDRALALAVESAARAAGAEACRSCEEQQYAPKCGFCHPVKAAIADSKKPSR
jgi:formate dehydrogenase maturation protein FdhE